MATSLAVENGHAFHSVPIFCPPTAHWRTMFTLFFFAWVEGVAQTVAKEVESE